VTNVNGVETKNKGPEFQQRERELLAPSFSSRKKKLIPIPSGMLIMLLPINVFLGVDSFRDDSVVQVIWKRELNENSMHLGVIVQSLDLGQQFVLRDRWGQVEELKVHASLKKHRNYFQVQTGRM
jgi:hypothetical protein